MPHSKRYRCPSAFCAAVAATAGLLLQDRAAAASIPPPPASPLDTLQFGVPKSEQAHDFVAAPGQSSIIQGGLGETARQLLPLGSSDPNQNWQGGRMAFTLTVDPARQNYVTARFWGSDVTPDRLILFCEGKQIGYHHLGDVDLLDFGSDIGEPGCLGRFFYNTTPLPLSLTRGKTRLHFEIRSIGRIWAYGDTFTRYQYPMTEPTRGIYRVYSHTGGCFVPPADEKQGGLPTNPPPPVRPTPGPEVLEAVKARVNREVDNLLGAKKPLNQMQNQFLARAYRVKWTGAYQNPHALARIVEGLDAAFAAYRQNPRLAESDPATPNADWFGLGPSADVIRLLAEPLAPYFDQMIPDRNGQTITRRKAFAEMEVACRDWHRQHRRLYTNQTMINDTFGIYLPNRAVAILDPSQAMPEDKAMRYLYESVGLLPWRDSDASAAFDALPVQNSRWGVGSDYREITDKGLTRELGYVGTYGEVLDWCATLYDATRLAPDQPGDPKIKTQIEKIAHARAPFRYPDVDKDGNRAMRLEPIIGWRDSHYPSDVTYGERTTWDGSPLYLAAQTLDPAEAGYAQQMLADNQYFASVADRMRDKGFRVTNGLLATPNEYEWLKAQPPQPSRLPMSGASDVVWTDEQDGVVAIKHGDEILYISLYWRARNAVNFRARVHDITPRFDRIAVVHEEVEYDPSGLTFIQPDNIDTEMPGGGHRYPDPTLHQAFAGEELPIAKLPEGIAFKPGDENVFAGKGTFYTLRYGPYLIGMNMTANRSFTLAVPPGTASAPDLVSGRTLNLANPVSVAPRSTVVLYMPN